jgi:hypothetical protein
MSRVNDARARRIRQARRAGAAVAAVATSRLVCVLLSALCVASPAWGAAAPGSAPQPAPGDDAASRRVEIVVVTIVVACVAIVASWGLRTWRARRRARESAD